MEIFLDSLPAPPPSLGSWESVTKAEGKAFAAAGPWKFLEMFLRESGVGGNEVGWEPWERGAERGGWEFRTSSNGLELGDKFGRTMKGHLGPDAVA